MTGIYGRETEPVLDAYEFSSFKTVVDVGGGNGMQLAAILKRHPGVQGILFDLPAVVDRARCTIARLGVSDRMRIESGDFLSTLPAGADAYVLRHIIHGWEVAEATAILRQCRKAVAPDGKVLIIEMVVPPGNEAGFSKWVDLMMLLVAGRERTKEEYDHLLSNAGLSMTRVIPTASDVSIIEAVRAL